MFSGNQYEVAPVNTGKRMSGIPSAPSFIKTAKSQPFQLDGTTTTK